MHYFVLGSTHKCDMPRYHVVISNNLLPVRRDFFYLLDYITLSRISKGGDREKIN